MALVDNKKANRADFNFRVEGLLLKVDSRWDRSTEGEWTNVPGIRMCKDKKTNKSSYWNVIASVKSELLVPAALNSLPGTCIVASGNMVHSSWSGKNKWVVYCDSLVEFNTGRQLVSTTLQYLQVSQPTKVDPLALTQEELEMLRCRGSATQLG